MDHIKSSFYFVNTRDTWKVDYTYDKSNYNQLKATVYLNDELYWDFDEPCTWWIENPTKSQAKEIISSAKKEYKAANLIRDNRDKKIDTIINS